MTQHTICSVVISDEHLYRLRSTPKTFYYSKLYLQHNGNIAKSASTATRHPICGKQQCQCRIRS